ncbi:DUF4397 domain-containing protein [Flaviaesturariibacter flavus]|uniref:DUF4397 domain-containing protein n=1 Tax=Flaviaesturariibacter flavus TaxID=2502780 RepID=A0A4R1BNY6_9BACT|nr:DUF4397 domain-containing protein [Flaviaesturariibacter flavus]TCJ19284.1 DUF4397 domain-containing protein [Flaviaesturariibacter flavus]
MKKTIFGFAFLAMLVVACKKEATITERFTPAPEGNANVKFLNFATNAPALNFFVNGTKVSGAAAASNGSVTGISYGSIFPSTVAYVSVPAGSVKIDGTVIESSTVMPGAALSSATQTLAPGKFYTYALVDTFTQASGVLIEDDLSIDMPTKAYVRMANFASDSSVTVTITKTSPTNEFAYTRNFTGIAPKTVTSFDTVSAGASQVYTVTYKRVSNGATLATASTTFTPARAKKYTFYLAGQTRASTTLKSSFYTHN